LEERFRTVFDAGDHAARGEGGLLDVAVEVFWVLVQDEFAEFVELVGRSVNHASLILCKLR
jgi:hypothetical protein